VLGVTELHGVGRSLGTLPTMATYGGCSTSRRTSQCWAWSGTTSHGCRRGRSPRGPPLSPRWPRSPVTVRTSPSISSRRTTLGCSSGCSRTVLMSHSGSSLTMRRVLRSYSRLGSTLSWPPRSRSRCCACRPRPLRQELTVARR
jgi:hypothetical protein